MWCLPWVIGRLAPGQGCAAVNQVGRKEAAVLGSQQACCELAGEGLRLTARNPGVSQEHLCAQLARIGVCRVLWVLAWLLQAAEPPWLGGCMGMRTQVAALGLFADCVFLACHCPLQLFAMLDPQGCAHSWAFGDIAQSRPELGAMLMSSCYKVNYKN